MLWPEYPWPEPGNWYSQDGVATSEQSQGVSALAENTISGQAVAGQSQGISALAQITIFGQSITGQEIQTIDGIISGDIHIIGGSSTGQSSQSLQAVGFPRISGIGDIRQGGQTASGTGSLLITGRGSSGQGQSSAVFAFKDPSVINSSLYRMLEYPHSAVFDKAPDEELVLVLSASQSLTWIVSKGVLSVTANGHMRKYALRQYTFSQLGDELQNAGVTLVYENPAFGSLGAHMLLDAAGDQSQSNGNKLYAYSADLWVLFAAYSAELDLAESNILEALKQMVITSAKSEWLDLWGKLYDHPRSEGKLDNEYAPEIPREAFRIRVNALGIENAILELTGKNVRIEEPWENMFRLDESALSGSDRLYDGSTTGYHLIRPVSTKPIDWSDVLSVIHRNKAAGVVVLEPEVRMAIYVDARVTGKISSVRTDTVGALVPLVVDGRLDVMQLSAGSYQRNYGVMMSSVIGYSAGPGSPVSASQQNFGTTGITWNDPNGWGNFTWSGDGDLTTTVETDATVYTGTTYDDVDTVEV